MNQLRIFVETAFFSSVKLLMDDLPFSGLGELAQISEPRFVDSARSGFGKALSDDSLRLIYRLYRDCWSHDTETDLQSITTPIYIAAKSMLRLDGRRVRVRYDKLYEWRDFTRLLGEDVYITALLAHENRDSLWRYPEVTPDLEYEPNLRNDDPQIEALLDGGNIYELHSHLKASVKIFDINWVCLMNHPAGREKEFSHLVSGHDCSGPRSTASRLCAAVGNAAALRFWLCRFLAGEVSVDDVREKVRPVVDGIFPGRFRDLESMISSYKRCGLESGASPLADYICLPACRRQNRGDFSVYLGERLFLYRCWLYIMRTGDGEFCAWFRYYILCKSFLRQHMVQLNSNHGFSNFQRYQNAKGLFVCRYPQYERMLVSLAVADASRDSAICGQEVRIAPGRSWQEHARNLRNTEKQIRSELDTLFEDAADKRPEYAIIYHFIKIPDARDCCRWEDDSSWFPVQPRNHEIRSMLARQSAYISHSARCNARVVGIDAAASEFNCRPEVFAQSFRFLRKSGLHATFHVGEDFYDIVDGMRAIDEAITFLDLQSGDRLGHVMAMGIDSRDFYHRINESVIIPAQWMLDNIAWLYCRSRDWNIDMTPDTQRFLEKNFRRTFNDIYKGCQSDRCIPVDIETYHLSMLLRGDNPRIYNPGVSAGGDEAPPSEAGLYGNEDWRRYALSELKSAEVARSNKAAVDLYLHYHYDADVRRRGDLVKEFKICPGYVGLIHDMQEKLMERVSKHDICIECCPSSNVLIGSLRRYDRHPIFRFYNVDPHKGRHMAVTVNTDDLGVFQTSLANEYSYLAMALTRQKDGEGKRVYSPHEIIYWLRRLADFSSQYRFRR